MDNQKSAKKVDVTRDIVLETINKGERYCYECGLNGEDMPCGITDEKSLSEIFDFSKGEPPQDVLKCLELFVKLLKNAYAKGKLEAGQEKAPTSAATEHEGTNEI